MSDVKLFTCDCGSNTFFNVVPHQFEHKDINNWNTFGLKAYAGTAAVLICLKCSYVHVPPANFSGKSLLDPNVAAYGEMLKAVESHNERLSISLDPNFEIVVNAVEMLIKRVEAIENKVCSCKITSEEEVGKLDKQTMPSPVEKPSDKGTPAPKSKEPRNKGKATKTKVKKLPKPSMDKVQGPN